MTSLFYVIQIMKENIKDILMIHLYNLEKEVESLCKDERLQILYDVFKSDKQYIEDDILLERITNNHKEELERLNNLHLSEIEILVEKIKYIGYIRNIAKDLLERCFGVE